MGHVRRPREGQTIRLRQVNYIYTYDKVALVHRIYFHVSVNTYIYTLSFNASVYFITTEIPIQIHVCDTVHRSDVVLLCFSLSSRVSFRNCKAMWFPEIRQFCPQTPVLLVGCKNDLRFMYRDESYLGYVRERSSPFIR